MGAPEKPELGKRFRISCFKLHIFIHVTWWRKKYLTSFQLSLCAMNTLVFLSFFVARSLRVRRFDYVNFNSSTSMKNMTLFRPNTFHADNVYWRWILSKQRLKNFKWILVSAKKTNHAPSHSHIEYLFRQFNRVLCIMLHSHHNLLNTS